MFSMLPTCLFSLFYSFTISTVIQEGGVEAEEERLPSQHTSYPTVLAGECVRYDTVLYDQFDVPEYSAVCVLLCVFVCVLLCVCVSSCVCVRVCE